MSDTDAILARTPLYDLHVEMGARMVPFAGYSMPVQYPTGVLKEHLHTRAAAGLFDVSHMGQLRLHGAQAAQALESLMPVDVVDLPLLRQRYALLTNATGGIIDDLMVTRCADHLLLVVNAACKATDLAHLREQLPSSVDLEPLPEQALLALQGPAARSVLTRLAPAAAALRFMQAGALTVAGIPCWVACSGYTGEDGFELSCAADQASALAQTLLADSEVALIGLGARDSLRLEAGLCLYGHDLDTTTTPVEAALGWALSKARKPGGARAGNYLGAQAIEAQLQNGPKRLRVLLRPEGRAPVREGCAIVDGQGLAVGRISSGGFGPSVGAPVAMGYVNAPAVEAPLFALLRDKPMPLVLQKSSFAAHRYLR